MDSMNCKQSVLVETKSQPHTQATVYEPTSHKTSPPQSPPSTTKYKYKQDQNHVKMAKLQ